MALFVLFVAVFDEAATATEIWSGNTTITKLYPYSANAFVFNTAYSNPTYSTCDNGTRWMIPRSHENYEIQVAAVLLAFSQGKSINMVITVLPAACEGTVNRFTIQ
jgi:hypothetical protein